MIIIIILIIMRKILIIMKTQFCLAYVTRPILSSRLGSCYSLSNFICSLSSIVKNIMICSTLDMNFHKDKKIDLYPKLTLGILNRISF